MSRLLLVSNRVASMKKTAQAGGAAVAIADVLRLRGGLWFGWSGKITESLPERIEIDESERASVVTTPLSPEENASYYLGYSNAVLWPVFHGRVDLAEFDAGHFDRYVATNERLARLLRPHIAPGDIIWVHDYHLIPFARALRDMGVDNPIGFFLHIPFPPPETFQTIPEHHELARALAHFDLIGMQTRRDVANLKTYLRRNHDAAAFDGDRMRIGRRVIAIESFPVGINPAEFAPSLGVPALPAPPGCVRAVGVDRLDYTKGLPHKVRAFARFLERNPSYRRKVVLTQIAPPTREKLQAYEEVRADLAEQCGRANGALGELEWVPIHYMNRAVARPRLIGIYRSSKLCLVTPLNDGMNLVAKEYVAAQDDDDPGVLVLSQFAGAAEALEEAIIVNPYSIDQMADAILTALDMPLAERRERHAALMQRIRKDDANAWCRGFLASLEASSNSVTGRRFDTTSAVASGFGR